MKTIFLILLWAVSAIHSSFAGEKTIAQLQSELVASYVATVQGVDEPRIFKITGVTQKNDGTLLLEATWSVNGNQGAVPASASLSGQQLVMQFFAPSINQVTVTQTSTGVFEGTYAWKDKTKTIKLQKASGEEQKQNTAPTQTAAVGPIGPITPLASGSLLSIKWLAPKQSGGQPIEFFPEGPKALDYRFVVEENGDKKLFRAKENYISFAYDKSFTNIIWDNQPLEKEQRFMMFPQEGRLPQPGETWNVPTWKNQVSCGVLEVNFKAASENGPEINLTINGNITTVKTIRINYDGIRSGCGGSKYAGVDEILYSPELAMVVSWKTITYTPGGQKTSLLGGRSWVITAVKTISGQNQHVSQ